jgi:exosortase
MFQRLAAKSPAAWAVGLLLWGMVVYLWGWRAGRVLAFPIGFLAFGLSLQPTLVAPVGFGLQHVTAVGAETLADSLGVVVVREGLVLRSDQFALVVAEVCSGMNSLLALLGLASVWIHMVQGTVLARLAILASVLPLIIVANITRVTAVVLVAAHFGQDIALGFFHGGSSLLLFGMAVAGLCLVSRMVGCKTIAVT